MNPRPLDPLNFKPHLREKADLEPPTEKRDSSSPGKVFVIHHGALGDLVTAFPLFQALKAAGFWTHLLCQGHLGALAQTLGLVQKAHALESAHFASLFREAPDGRAEEAVAACDLVLALSGSEALVSGLSRFFAGPIHRIDPRPDPGSRIHVADHLLSACAKLELIRLSPEARKTEPEPVSSGPAPSKTLWIHPGAGSPAKRWPLERFVETAHLLAAEGWRPQFLLGPAETSLEPLLTDAAPGFPIMKVAEVLPLARTLKTARAFIGNDSGVSHLAAFLGLSTLSVFGPTDPMRWRPLGPRAATVRGPAPCNPCFETGKRDCRDPICLTRVTPQAVLKAFFDLTQSGGNFS